jgi:hypothetical protein
MRRIILLGSLGMLLLAGQLGLGQQAPCSAGETWEKTAYGGYCKPNGGEGAAPSAAPTPPTQPQTTQGQPADAPQSQPGVPNTAAVPTQTITADEAAKLTDQQLLDAYNDRFAAIENWQKTKLANPDQLAPGFDHDAYTNLAWGTKTYYELANLTIERFNRLKTASRKGR